MEGTVRGGGHRRTVVLVGPRAAGKTTLAAALGVALGWDVVDSDAALATAVGMPVADFLRQEGEAAFRAIEERIVLASLAADGPRVLALGGGAVLSAAVRQVLSRSEHFVVFLLAPVPVLVDRQEREAGRPPLTPLPLAAEVRYLLESRHALYAEVADMRLDTFSANAAVCGRTILVNMARTDC